MNFVPQLLLLGSVVAVGILHTVVPDHWVPITLLARQQKWSKSQTAKAAFQAGSGHVLSTLAIALVVWIAGVAVATQYGNLVDRISGVALVTFGLWMVFSSLRELNDPHGHFHGSEYHPHEHGHDEVHSHTSKRTALLLIVGSSPMVEGIPAFFAASKYGVALLIPMAVLFAVSTIATYIVLCVYSQEALKQVRIPLFEKYGEVLSGAFIALVGFVFLVIFR